MTVKAFPRSLKECEMECAMANALFHTMVMFTGCVARSVEVIRNLVG